MPKKPIDRNKLKRIVVLNMRKKGYSLQEIGDTVSLTRQRISKIIKRWAIDK